jgi:hypothetical protein
MQKLSFDMKRSSEVEDDAIVLKKKLACEFMFDKLKKLNAHYFAAGEGLD